MIYEILSGIWISNKNDINKEFLISKRKSIRFIVSKNLTKVLNTYNEQANNNN